MKLNKTELQILQREVEDVQHAIASAHGHACDDPIKNKCEIRCLNYEEASLKKAAECLEKDSVSAWDLFQLGRAVDSAWRTLADWETDTMFGTDAEGNSD